MSEQLSVVEEALRTLSGDGLFNPTKISGSCWHEDKSSEYSA